jgi:hypothetical protein
MARPKGSRNKRTVLKEAEQHVGSKYVDQVLDSLYVLEMGMRHFFIRAEVSKGRKQSDVRVRSTAETGRTQRHVSLRFKGGLKSHVAARQLCATS